MKNNDESSKPTYYPVSRDLVFKTAFNNKELLNVLLNECFETRVKIIKFIPAEQTVENKNEKKKDWICWF